ncbi:MAG: tetratricopeptide repeat protein [Alistipes sp.]|nr:tetratricopeptide repeat protein [Alistipes sp.]
MAAAQNMPERGLVRKGNRLFDRELYTRSSGAYQQALLQDSTLFEGRYNLANSLIRQAMADTVAMANMLMGSQNPNGEESAEANLSAGYLSQAEGLLKAATIDSLQSEDARADAYYNLGNAQFVQQKLQEALSSYRKALTLRPDDMEAKYNYAYTKKLLEQQQNQNQDQNNDQNQDQNQNQNQNNDQNQNQNQDQNQNNDQNQQNNDQNKDGGGDDKQDKQDEPKSNDQDKQNSNQNRNKMSEEQQQQLLDAIQAQEDKTQDKLDKKAKGVIIKGRKNW